MDLYYLHRKRKDETVRMKRREPAWSEQNHNHLHEYRDKVVREAVILFHPGHIYRRRNNTSLSKGLETVASDHVHIVI